MRNLSLLVILIFVSCLAPLRVIAQEEPISLQYVSTIGRGTITAAAWIANDEQVAVAGSRGVWIYDTDFNDVAHIDAGDVTKIAVSSDYTYLATFGTQGLNIWDGTSFDLIDKVDAAGQITWMPNTHLLTIGTPSEVQIWNAETGEFEPTLPFNSEGIVDMAWSPDGTKLAIGSQSQLQIWDSLNPATPLTINLDDRVTWTTRPLHLDWSPDSTEIAVVAGSTSPSMPFNTLTIIDATTGNTRLIIQAGPSDDVDWNPDGTFIATASSDFFSYGNATVNVWDAQTGEYVVWLPQHSRGAHTVAWKSDGQYLLSAAYDNTAVIIEVNRQASVMVGRETKVLRGHTGAVNVLDWSPDETQVATGGDDGSVRFWDTLSGEQLPKYFPADLRQVQAIDWSPDGSYVAAGGGQNIVHIMGMSEASLISSAQYEHGWTNSPGEGNPGGIGNLIWSPDSQKLASMGYDAQVYIWSELAAWPNIVNQIGNINLSRMSISWYSNSEQILLADGSVHRWDDQSGIAEKNYTCGDEVYVEGWIVGAELSPDEKYITIFISDGGLCLLDAKSSELIYYNPMIITKIIWNPDSQWFIAFEGYSHPEIKLFNVHSNEPQTLEITGISAAWSPDGRYLAVGKADGSIDLFLVQGIE